MGQSDSLGQSSQKAWTKHHVVAVEDNTSLNMSTTIKTYIDIDYQQAKVTQQLDHSIVTAILAVTTPSRITPARNACRPRLSS
jgi:hypothetical protein